MSNKNWRKNRKKREAMEEAHPFKLGDKVNCLGEANDVFKVVGLREGGCFLSGPRGGHGWESNHKLTKISE